ncbi:MAG: hypothetical protein AAGA42_15410 [Actinomycetota bacterium]
MTWTTPSAGYDPVAIERLRRAVVAALDGLSSLRCDDPAAERARTAVRATRQNLEDHWLRLLDEILRSEAMVAWNVGMNDPTRMASTALQRWITDRTLGSTTGLLAYADDAALLGLLTQLGLPVDDSGDFDAAAVDVDHALIDELAFRSADPKFVLALIDTATTHPAFLAQVAPHLPTNALVSLTAALVGNVSWVDDAPTRATADGVAAALSELSARDPAALLPLLADATMLTTMGTWPMLDDDIVAGAVGAALHDTVATNPDQLDHGLDVLAALAELAPITFDSGMQPGLALGLAAALPVYLPVIGPAIRNEGSEPVRVESNSGPRTLASYDGLRELIGAITRHPNALTVVATSVGGYTTSITDRLGERLPIEAGVEHAAQVADLVRDALDDEHREAAAAAAAAVAGQRRFGSLIGTATGVLLTATGVGGVVRSAAPAVARLATSGGTPNTPPPPARSITAETYDTITIEALRAALGADHIEMSAEDRTRLADAVALADTNDDDLEGRREAIIDADRLGLSIPAVGRFLDGVRRRSGIDELREDRRDGD